MNRGLEYGGQDPTFIALASTRKDETIDRKRERQS